MLQTPRFRTLDPEQLTVSPFHLIGKEWMLITAGTSDKFNTMTASWGGLGVLWGRPVAFCVVRPQRHTFSFMEQSGSYSLTFFDAAYRDALNYCGSHSGRDVDKVAATGLTPVVGDAGAVYFQEARLVIECRKLYAQDLQEAGFVDHSVVDQNYPARDFHRMYVGEVVQMLVREG